jgi:hypothetical protein
MTTFIKFDIAFQIMSIWNNLSEIFLLSNDVKLLQELLLITLQSTTVFVMP